MEPDIFSANGLKQTIETRKDSVVAILCDDASDLQKIEFKLNSLQIPFTLYDPYKHDYEVIIQFLDQVESQRKGQTSFHSAYHSLGEIFLKSLKRGISWLYPIWTTRNLGTLLVLISSWPLAICSSDLHDFVFLAQHPNS